MSLSTFILLISLLICNSTIIFSQSPISQKLKNDTVSIAAASVDFGHIVTEIPEAVFFPTTPNDIKTLITQLNTNDNNTSDRRRLAARGQGHSVRGQSMAKNGIVVNMSSLSNNQAGNIGVVSDQNPNNNKLDYVDVGGEQIWIDVLKETLKHGLSPLSWTDYLSLSVGGTLSNAGISGQSFRFGPQINNVLELDVITGKGDFVTCSRNNEEELFYSVLGGLGQFGIITRARIALAPAPTRVKWVRLLYKDFSSFSNDQESLISMEKNGVDYLEGFILMRQCPLDLSFYPNPDQLRVTSLVTQFGIVYAIELGKYYDDRTKNSVDKEVQILVNGLSYVPGFGFVKDVTYLEFLNRVESEEEKLRKIGLWEIPHPWLNLFVPKSQMPKFDSGVFKDILLKQKVPAGLVIVYPMNRNKWDDKMSVVIPNEDVFYTVGFLHSSSYAEWEAFDNVNKQILQFCHDSGLLVKQYLPHYQTQQDWINHFGSKWDNFFKMKNLYDPKKILSPGQHIFTSN